jgi:hypothetical protein
LPKQISGNFDGVSASFQALEDSRIVCCVGWHAVFRWDTGVMYFLVPRLLQVNLSTLQSAGLALMLYHGACMGEDIRGGIQADA